MKLWPGIFQVTNCIVKGGNGGFLIEYRITVTELRNSVGWYI